MLKCPCGLAYIGKTSRALKTRKTEHRCAIHNNDMKSPVAVNFNKAHHNISTLKYICIEVVEGPSRGGDVDSLLLRRELFWVYTLENLTPRGLNKDFNIIARLCEFILMYKNISLSLFIWTVHDT